MTESEPEAEVVTQEAAPEPEDPAAKAPAKEAPEEKTPGKKTPGKRSAAKKTTAKKATAKNATAKKATAKNATAKKAAASVPKYPRHSVERALRIPQAIYNQNAANPATPTEAAKFLGGTGVSGAFNVEMSSAKKYGFLESEDGKLVVTDRARKAIAPQSNDDKRNALRDAILAAPEMSAVYNFYRGENLPDNQFLVNALTDRFKIPADKVPEFLDLFTESIKSAGLLDESGERPRLFDIGRDEAHKPGGKSAAKAKAAAVTGATCFIMQPFAAPLGGYYESIFKPAVTQAGLTAVRADAEIFGTGKIIDQIWRGIRDADVLVAELTTKNPNVFYELGLAHAYEKPVVLVSSNQDDVPFDLRHIRVILYDQTDPFWGQKLIDKVADNIRSALNNPEDAIFRADQS
ncbi:hypothetical protein [Nocardioides rubriscoriae]|uniref:hypothetical protein n=1 Tax=Nocardioides rubriscoriae TaxID=642762 RepID=UPI001B88427C|nr:hypothetical protein [Nocardioides rubriscoriae]